MEQDLGFRCHIYIYIYQNHAYIFSLLQALKGTKHNRRWCYRKSRSSERRSSSYCYRFTQGRESIVIKEIKKRF